MERGAVKPQRFKYHSELLAADVLATVGYRASCPCGWLGPVRKKRRDASVDARVHNQTHRS
jgi:hypothetical protein